MPSSALLRSGGLCAIAGAVLACAGNALTLVADPVVPVGQLSYPLPAETFLRAQVFFAATQALMLLGLVALAAARAGGTGRSARIGSVLAVAGSALTVPGEVALGLAGGESMESSAASTASSIFGLGGLLGSVGLIVLGVAILRTRSSARLGWRRWQRSVPVALGTYSVLIQTPVLIAADFQGPAAFWAITGADVGFALIGVALLQAAATVRRDVGSSRRVGTGTPSPVE